MLLPVTRSIRLFSSSPLRALKRIKETTAGNVTTVELESLPELSNERYFQPDPEHKSKNGCSCPLCQIPVKITYQDVLILEQFMRVDGTVFPSQFTGLCWQQQLRLERCVMQAHWSGLFPDRTVADFDRSGYKRFNRHWKSDMSMYGLELKFAPGSWFYLKRYNPRELECKRLHEGRLPNKQRDISSQSGAGVKKDENAK